MATDEEEFVKIAIIEGPFESQVIQSVLDEEQIPHLVRSYYDTAYDGLFQFQKGWGEIRSFEKYRTRIIGILDEIRKDVPEEE